MYADGLFEKPLPFGTSKTVHFGPPHQTFSLYMRSTPVLVEDCFRPAPNPPDPLLPVQFALCGSSHSDYYGLSGPACRFRQDRRSASKDGSPGCLPGSQGASKTGKIVDRPLLILHLRTAWPATLHCYTDFAPAAFSVGRSPGAAMRLPLVRLLV